MIGLLLAIALPLAIGCQSLGAVGAFPKRTTTQRGQLAFYTEGEHLPDDSAMAELDSLRLWLSVDLDIAIAPDTIRVYLLPDEEAYLKFMHVQYPHLPPRRAFFVHRDSRLMIYAYQHDRLQEDLRHEVTHGYLHATIPHIPLWLDEGLAEYYEVGREARGLNLPHAQLLLREYQAGRWEPDLRALEALAGLEDMTQLHYAESWAWVHLLMHTSESSRKMLVDHLSVLKHQDKPVPLSVMTSQLPSDMLVQHIYLLNR
jgi:hypothetical protein